MGAVFYNSRNFEASREPFEAALKMAPDDKFRLKVYEALIPSYRLLSNSDKMIDACEFIIENSDRSAQQSLTRTALLGDEKKALAAAKKSHESAAESRNDQLAHFWHRGLGDVLLATGEAKLAVPHFEQAIELTKIEGYIKSTKESLTEAREKAGL